MKAYKLTYEENQSGFNATFKTTAYSEDEIKSSKEYHEERGRKLIDIEDISVN